MSNKHLKEAINLLGGSLAFAEQLELITGLKVSRGKVWNWLNRDKGIPPIMALGIEKMTDGKVTRQQLRPDINWMAMEKSPK